MQLYPSYQLPPQVRALASRSVGGPGGSPTDVYMIHPRGGGGANSMVQAPQQNGVPQAAQDVAAYNQQQQEQAQRAISGTGPGIMPMHDQQQFSDQAAQQVAQQQFLAGAAQGMGEGGLRSAPPPSTGTPQWANLPPQVAALANSYGAPQVQGVQQPGTVQPVRPDLSNQAGFNGGYRRSFVR